MATTGVSRPGSLDSLRAAARQVDQLATDLRAARELRMKLVRTVGHRFSVAELAEAAGVLPSTIELWLQGPWRVNP